MVAIEAIRKSNARIAELPAGLVALFLGGTSGIGQSALIQFATYAIQPRIYIELPAEPLPRRDYLRGSMKKTQGARHLHSH
jgi:hypothetical protein